MQKRDLEKYGGREHALHILKAHRRPEQGRIDKTGRRKCGF